MWYRKFAVILLFICLVAADSAGVQKILQISKEKGTVTEYKDPYPKRSGLFSGSGVEMG